MLFNSNIAWPDLKERLKEVNPALSDEDLQYEPGKEEELLERLAIKMNRNVAEIKGWIESVAANNRIAY